MKDLLKRNRAELSRDEDARLWNAVQKANAGHTKTFWQRFSVPAMGLAVTAAALLIVIPRLGGVEEATDTMRRHVAAVEAPEVFEKPIGTAGMVIDAAGAAEKVAGSASDPQSVLEQDEARARELAIESPSADGQLSAPRPEAKDSAPGTITGTVTDADTGEALPFANVMVKGTDRGSITDDEGKFEIENVPPGEYDVDVAYMGYERDNESGVEIPADGAADVAFRLKKGPVATFEAEVLGSKEKLIDTMSTSVASSVGGEDLESLPVDEITDAIALKAGVTAKGSELQFRGGRAGEVTVMSEPGSPAPPAVVSGRFESRTGKDANERQRSRDRIERAIRRGERGPIGVGGSAVPNDAAFDAMYFESEGVNPFIDTEDDNLATFAIDVDTASYSMTRAYLNRGALPPADAIRVEEFINAFDHSYGREGFASLTPSITSTGDAGAFGIYLDAAPSPFGENLSLVRVGLKGREVGDDERKPMTLTFVIDVSGSMKRGGRLELVKDALKMLLDQLRPSDFVAIVTYSNTAHVLAPATPLRDRWQLERAIERLVPDGGTNAEAGLREAYRIAEHAYDGERNNRVILCSDGVANIGSTGADSIFEVIKREAGRGIYLTGIGVGMGNHNDALLEQLCNQADGNYHYVDSRDDARRVFVDDMIGTMEAIARDMKIQVAFDPDAVTRYRLIGYENRDVADSDFRNDAVDGGEVGAGHEVTALFEVKLAKGADGDDPLATVTLRYEDLASGLTTEQAGSLPVNEMRAFESTDPEFRLDAAVAEFAEILRRSYWAREGQFSDVAVIVDEVGGSLPARDDVRELSRLIRRAADLWPFNDGGHWSQKPVRAYRE
jgi:Ca-activated chloride channel family protein